MKAFALATLALILIVAGYSATHTKVWGNCHMTDEGRACKLIGYK